MRTARTTEPRRERDGIRRFEVLHTEKIHGAGKLVALCSIALDIESVEIILQIVQVRQTAAGGHECRAAVQAPEGRQVVAVPAAAKGAEPGNRRSGSEQPAS